jgi:transposase InsO family protein
MTTTPRPAARFPIADEPAAHRGLDGLEGRLLRQCAPRGIHEDAQVGTHRRQSWPTKAKPRAAVFIEVFYNRERPHPRLGYHSPAEFEMIMSPPQVEVAIA